MIPLRAEFAEKTVAYAEAKTAYFTALREEMAEPINTATRRKLRPLQLDNFFAAFSVAAHKKQKAADEKTVTLIARLSGNANLEKARAEFECAQKVEETFHKDFDGIDFTIYFFISLASRFVFACSTDGSLSLILPRKYRPPFWGFTLSKAAMTRFCLSIFKLTGRPMILIRSSPSECSGRIWVI